jgi:hypothetical protein
MKRTRRSAFTGRDFVFRLKRFGEKHRRAEIAEFTVKEGVPEVNVGDCRVSSRHFQRMLTGNVYESADCGRQPENAAHD